MPHTRKASEEDGIVGVENVWASRRLRRRMLGQPAMSLKMDG